MSKLPLRILLFGPLPNMIVQKVGGARISFSHLTEGLAQEGGQITVINTKRWEGNWKRIFNPGHVLFSLFKNGSGSEVVFLNVSQGGTKFLAPLIYLFAKMSGQLFIFRPFGGSLKDRYQRYPFWQKWIFQQTTLKADLFYLQTLELMQFFADLGANTQHLPTSRNEPPANLLPSEPEYRKRFVFMGHLKVSKGIDQLLEARQALDDSYTIHLYGPIKEKKYQYLQQEDGDCYQGILDKEQVLKTLRQYDVVVLPTFFSGEGYPGIIMEAYSLGMPVITTRWKAIPEIVEHQKTGLLIAPRSTTELLKSIRYFNTDNYQVMAQQSRQHFVENFQSQKVIRQIMDDIRQLLNLANPS